MYAIICLHDRENAENMYYFSALALTLNELEEGVSLTDSRLRPDQRLMEAGRWDEANTEKQRLEEKQRAARRRREAEVTEAQEEGDERGMKPWREGGLERHSRAGMSNSVPRAKSDPRGYFIWPASVF